MHPELIIHQHTTGTFIYFLSIGLQEQGLESGRTGTFGNLWIIKIKSNQQTGLKEDDQPTTEPQSKFFCININKVKTFTLT